MSKRKFIPEGKLEEAILKRQNGKIIQLIAEGAKLHRPDILAAVEFFSLSLRTASVVVGCGMDDRLRKEALFLMKTILPEFEFCVFIEGVEKIPEGEPSEEEEKFMRAIAEGNERKICHLTEEEMLVLRSMSPEICAALFRALPKLSHRAAVQVFAEGIHPASVPSVLKCLLRGCESATLLNEEEYKEKLMLANLLIHILQEEITPEDDDLIMQDWYPMGNSIEDGCGHRAYCHSYSYYYDPRHIYKPRFADGE